MGDDYGHPDLASKAVRDGISVSEFQTVLLNARKSKGGTVDYGQGGRSKDNLADDKKHGFRNLGHFCHDVVQACKRNGRISETLSRAASTFSNEAAGPDGGYLIPPEFSTSIASIGLGEESLLSLCDTTEVSGNGMTYPKDESTPWGSTGVVATWEGEANQTTPTKPSVGEASLKLKKLKVLVAATEELLGDATAMSSYITRKMGEAVDWKEQDAIVNGTGAGTPLGITKSGVTVVQTKESGQSADTIVAGNIAKMYSRVIQGAGARLVWLVNPDAFPQIITLTLNNNPIWIPNNSGMASAPNGFLMGRPLLFTDACQTVGDKFDIIFANMNGYRAITKAGGADLQTSMHLWFDQDLMAFRLIFRMDGQTTFSAPITPPNSAVTRSHFVCLEAR
jgi:HK97 family phage major capsid protein